MTIFPAKQRRTSALQLAFEGIFGLLLPIGAMLFGSGIFTGGQDGLASGGWFDLHVAALLSMMAAIPLLTIWLVIPTWRPKLATVCATAFMCSGCLLIILGVALLRTVEISLGFLVAMVTEGPDLIGLLMIVLAFFAVFPFISGFIYIRHSVEVFKLSRMRDASRSRWSAAAMGLAGILLVLVIPLSVQAPLNIHVEQNLKEVVSGTPNATAALARLKMAIWCPSECYRDIVQAIVNADSDRERNRLRDAYRDVTGHDAFTANMPQTSEK